MSDCVLKNWKLRCKVRGRPAPSAVVNFPTKPFTAQPFPRKKTPLCERACVTTQDVWIVAERFNSTLFSLCPFSIFMVRIITGDETGILKCVNVERETIARWAPQSRENGVQRLCWSGPPGKKRVKDEFGTRHPSDERTLTAALKCVV